MGRFDRIYAVACACCKADGANIPEVEAVIRLLLPQIRSALATILAAIAGRTEELLAGEHREKDLALLLAAYVPAAKRLGLRPLSPLVVRNVERSARALMVSAAEAAGLPVPSDAQLRARSMAAAEQLQLLIEQALADAVDRSVPTVARLALAPPPFPGSPESPDALLRELERSLAILPALQPLVDGWSYRNWNTATVRASAAAGHNFIQLVAQVDFRTTAFCRLVNGRVVPMARILGQLDAIDRAAAAGDVDALIGATPFISNPRDATPTDVDRMLERGGLAPFHHGCRTQNVPVRLNPGAATS